MDISQAYAPQKSRSGRGSEFRRGAAAGLPVLLGIIPYALVLGAQDAGMSLDRIRDLAGSRVPIRRTAAAPGDPGRRCPDLSRAREVLGWEPLVDVDDGLRRTLAWFSERISALQRV